jgi:hypothetical protein
MMSNKKIMLTGACLLACLGGGGAIATAGDEGAAPAPPPEMEAVQAAEAEPVTTVDPEQAEQVHQLERPRTADDAMPVEWRQELTEGEAADDQYGANPALARRTAPGTWIVPADGYICVANTTPTDGSLGFGCATPEDVEQGLLAPADIDKNGNGVLTGVLPDGVSEVKLVNSDGSSRSVPVERNTYRAAITADLKEVQFTDARGGDHVLPMAFRP